ncbi:MAG: hypothetical protein EAZ44_02065 [Cytophagia bacterium]|nr:MAG: hypothetical protein EAZ44_02065 [Cytophagia bacterium]TAG42720.1 MAG: hypothetical protein EAZ31_05595 [Cytophagia bacterium]
MEFKIITQNCKIESDKLTLFLRLYSNDDIQKIDKVTICNIRPIKSKIIKKDELLFELSKHKKKNKNLHNNNVIEIQKKEEEVNMILDFSGDNCLKEIFNKSDISVSFDIKYTFVTKDNKVLDNVYRLTLKKENNKIIEPIESFKRYNRKLAFNYGLFLLLYFTWFSWNSFNDNVYNSLISQELINWILAAVVLFLGIDSTTTFSMLKFGSGNIKKVMSNPGILINEDLKFILNNYTSTFILISLNLLSLFLIYSYFLPINIVIKNKEFTPYIKFENKYKKLDTKKIYSFHKDDVFLIYSNIEEKNIMDIEKPIEIAKLNTNFSSIVYSFINNSIETSFVPCQYKYKTEDGSCELKNNSISFFNSQDSLTKIKCYKILLKNLKSNGLSFSDSTYLISFDKKLNEIKLQLKSTKTQATMSYSSLINVQIDEVLLPDSLLFKTNHQKYKTLFSTFNKELKKEIDKCFCHPNKKTLMYAYEKLQNIIEEKCHTYPRNLMLIWLMFDNINNWEKNFGISEFDENDLNIIIKKTFTLFEKNKDKLPDETIKVSYIKFSVLLRKIFNIERYNQNIFNFSKDLIEKFTDKKLPYLYQHYIETLVDSDLDIINKKEELFLDSLVQSKPMGVQFYILQKNKCKNQNTNIYYKLNQWENLIKKGIPIDKLKVFNNNVN